MCCGTVAEMRWGLGTSQFKVVAQETEVSNLTINPTKFNAIMQRKYSLMIQIHKRGRTRHEIHDESVERLYQWLPEGKRSSPEGRLRKAILFKRAGTNRKLLAIRPPSLMYGASLLSCGYSRRPFCSITFMYDLKISNYTI